MHRHEELSLPENELNIGRNLAWKPQGLGFFGIIASVILFALLLISPWLLGGRHPYLYQFICIGVVASVFFWLLSQIRSRSHSLIIPSLTLPLFLAILYGLIQLLPLSPSIVSKISPTASRMWSLSEIPAGIKKSDEVSSSKQTISLYPASTRYHISLITLASIVFLLSAHFLASDRAQTTLWWLLLINGAAITIFGIWQNMTWDGKIYWFYKPDQVSMAFGPYVNRNHGAGYLLMCLSGGLGLLMSNRIIKRDSKNRSRKLKKNSQLSYLIAGVLTLCILVGILSSLSRGAFVAMAGAGLMTLFFSAKYAGRGLKFPTHLIAVVGLAMVVLVSIGLSSSVSNRLNTIADQDLSMNPRLNHWQEASQTVPHFWVTGSGLGTYRYIHRFYMKHPAREWFYNADNQYLEALVEGGVIGLGLLVLLIAMMLGVMIFSMRKVPGLRVRPFTLAISFALLSQSIHAFFDFGLYAPANMLLLAAICGAGAGKACQFSELAKYPQLITLSRFRSATLSSGFIFILLLLSTFPTWEAHTSFLSKKAQDELVDVVNNPLSSQIESDLAIMRFTKYLEQNPDNMRLQVAAAQAWIGLYRHRAYSLLEERKRAIKDREKSGSSKKKLEVTRDLVIWKQASVDNLYQQAFRLSELKQKKSITHLRNQPVVKETLRPAFRHLLKARRCSPLLPWTHFTLAKLSFLIRDPRGENPFLMPITQEATMRSDLMYRVGLYYFNTNELELASYYWQLSNMNSDRYSQKIYNFASQISNKSEYAKQLLPHSTTVLIEMATTLPQDDSRRKILLKRATDILQQTKRKNAEFYYQNGIVAELNLMPSEAIQYFQKAIQLAPDNLSWRYHYAKLLEAEGHLKEAIFQAKTCSQLEPTNKKYKSYFLTLFAKQPVSSTQ